MALLNENEYKWKKIYVYVLPNLFSYTVTGQSLCLGFMVVETVLAPLYKESTGDSSKTALPCCLSKVKK